MDEQERYEQLQRQRRARREAARKKHERNRRIFFGSIFLVILLIIIIIFKACGSGSSEKNTETSAANTTAETETETSASASLSITTPEVTTVSADLVFAGDIMCYDDQISAAATDSGYDFSSCFTNVTDYISAADLAVANLELNFYDGSEYTGYPSFKAPEALASDLASAGFDIMQTANTYSILNGLTGLSYTLDNVRAAGMDAIGTYTSEEDAEENGVLVKNVNGITIAFIAFTKGVNNATVPSGSEYCVDLLYTDYDSSYSDVDTTAITEKIAAAKEQEPDVIIALLHWGSEYDVYDSDTISSSQEEIEDLMFSEGVDVIIGTHPHVLGSLEKKTVTTSDGEEKEVFVAYSLGNFLSSMTTDDTQATLLLNLEIVKDSTGEVSIGEISYVPLYILNDAGDVEILDIHASLEDDTLDSDTAATLEDALATIHEYAGTEYDIVNVSSGDSSTATPATSTEASTDETGDAESSAESSDDPAA